MDGFDTMALSHGEIMENTYKKKTIGNDEQFANLNMVTWP